MRTLRSMLACGWPERLEVEPDNTAQPQYLALCAPNNKLNSRNSSALSIVFLVCENFALLAHIVTNQEHARLL